MSAIKNTFHNTICFQQELIRGHYPFDEEDRDVILRMLDCIERLELEKECFGTFLSSRVGLSEKEINEIEELKEELDRYEPSYSDEVRESWGDELMKGDDI